MEVDEVLYYIDGKSTTNNLSELIDIRKKQYMRYKETMPDERFYSYGAVNIGNDFKRENIKQEEIRVYREKEGYISPVIRTTLILVLK